MTTLPDGVRRRLVELAAAVVGELEDAETPAPLRRVRAFAPARRARAGAGPLAVALEREPAFRQRVAAAWRALHPDLAEALAAGGPPPAADPHTALAGVYLLRADGWQQALDRLVAGLAAADAEAAGARDRAEALGELESARREEARLRVELAAQQARATALEEELAGVRRELRRHRSDADRARAAVRAAQEAARQAVEEAGHERARADAATEQAAAARRQADERDEQARRAAREGRTLADVRARLLLDTLVEAAAGLRRELALPPATVRPADLVGPLGPAAPTDDAVAEATRPRALAADDPATLEALVRLPRAHLLVDGYNVTKSTYPALPLVEQRRRLVEGLAPLAARTGAEVTCVFDGAEVEGRSAAGLVRGVRVIFSEPGVTADDKLRRLVLAEPPGRVVVVVSSDREVAASARAGGARPVASAALARLLARA